MLHYDKVRTLWRNGSASDSRSERCVFKSHQGQSYLFAARKKVWITSVKGNVSKNYLNYLVNIWPHGLARLADQSEEIKQGRKAKKRKLTRRHKQEGKNGGKWGIISYVVLKKKENSNRQKMEIIKDLKKLTSKDLYHKSNLSKWCSIV